MISKIFKGKALYVALMLISAAVFGALMFSLISDPGQLMPDQYGTEPPAGFTGFAPGPGDGSSFPARPEGGSEAEPPEGFEMPTVSITGRLMSADRTSLAIMGLSLLIFLFSLFMLILRGRRRRLQERRSSEALSDEDDFTPVKRKHGIGRGLLVLAAALALLIALLPEPAGTDDSAQVRQELLEYTVKKGSITPYLVSAGSIAETKAEELDYAGEIKLEGWLAAPGDYVRKGQTIATVDKDSVILAIAELTELMAKLDAEINDSLDDIIENAIYAPMPGRVKNIHAVPGESVRDTVAEHSALLSLSVDGLMAADIAAAEGMYIGMELSVQLSDASVIPGRVESLFEGSATVVMSDEKAACGERVSICDSSGRFLSEAELYIHEEIRINGISGTVQRLNVEENMLVGTDMALIVLSDIAYRSERDLLTQQRRDMEQELTKLFELYNTGEIYSPCSGRIVALNEDVVLENLALTSGFYPKLLSAGGASMESLAVSVTAVDMGLITVTCTENGSQTTKQLDLSSIAVFSYSNGVYKPAAVGDIRVGDSLVIGFYVSGGSSVADHVIIYPAQSGNGGSGSQSGNQGSSGGQGTNQSGSTQSGSGKTGQSSEKTASGSTGTAQNQTEDAYSMASTVLCNISPFDEADISVTVDELDIKHYRVGQKLQLSFDALPGQSFTGTVTGIDPNGTNEGGSTKYAVTVSVPRTEDMLTGMNVSLRLELETVKDVLLIPLAAIDESDGERLVYTSYDAKTDTLADPAAVLTGVSDGTYAEIISGPEEGESIWYRYADSIEYTFQQ